ncbi:MAG: NUDIX hydrolase [Lachnospiraceae bacterium]|nr:NUDIX hydrolase [Lachnospiraceae bacterium]
MIENFELLKREELRRSSILTYCNDTYKLPNDSVVVYDMMLHGGASAVVPVMEDGKILMVRQYRPTVERATTEIPAGKRDPGEDFLEAAKRELEEETGYKAGKMEHLITVITAIAYCNEKIEVYVASDLTKTKQNLDDDEFIEFRSFDIEELAQMIYRGEIQDSKTIAALMAYKNKIAENNA